MKLILFLIWFCILSCSAVDKNALRECGNLHHFDFRTIPNSSAVYSNNNCLLKCLVDKKILSNNTINENYPCPKNALGVS